MGLYDSIDLEFTWDGDYTIGDDGDLGDTSSDYLLSLIQEIQTVVKSEIGDWVGDPAIGAGLSDFVGEPNTRENGKAIEQRIKTKIIEAGIVRPDDLNVRIVPTNIHQIMIIITVLATATNNNGLVVGDNINVSLLYDTMENGIFFMPISTAPQE